MCVGLMWGVCWCDVRCHPIPHFVWSRISHWTWSSSFQIDWVAIEPLSLCPTPPTRAEIQTCKAVPGLCVGAEDLSQSSCLSAKHFTRCNVSLLGVFFLHFSWCRIRLLTHFGYSRFLMCGMQMLSLRWEGPADSCFLCCTNRFSLIVWFLFLLPVLLDESPPPQKNPMTKCIIPRLPTCV